MSRGTSCRSWWQASVEDLDLPVDVQHVSAEMLTAPAQGKVARRRLLFRYCANESSGCSPHFNNTFCIVSLMPHGVRTSLMRDDVRQLMLNGVRLVPVLNQPSLCRLKVPT